MVDYIGAIKRPFLDLKKSGLVALLVWIPIVNFLVYGYFLDCAKLSLKNKKELPVWDYWGDKFIKGLLFIIIKMIYAIPLIIIMAFMMVNIMGEAMKDNLIEVMASGNPNSIISVVNSLFLNSEVVGILIAAIVVGILVSYLIPMGIVMYVANWKFKDAFDFKRLFNKVMTKQYFSAWLAVTVYSMLLMSIGNFIPFVGGIITSTLIGITSYTVFGEVYREIKV